MSYRVANLNMLVQGACSRSKCPFKNGSSGTSIFYFPCLVISLRILYTFSLSCFNIQSTSEMNRKTRMRISTEAQVDWPRILVTRTVLSGRQDVRGRHRCPVSGSGQVRTVSLSASISGGRSTTFIQDDRYHVNVGGEAITSTETNKIETMPSR